MLPLDYIVYKFICMSSTPVGGQQVVACPSLGVIVLLEPPVVARMVIRQCPHHVAANRHAALKALAWQLLTKTFTSTLQQK